VRGGYHERVPEPSTFFAWAESLQSMSYYEILRVAEDAAPVEIQEAFHELSLRCHPDRFVDDGPEVAAAASSVFKRAAEAYNVLRKPALRQRYDQELRRGQVKLDEQALVQPKKKFEQRTLLMIARTPTAKKHAAKADEALAKGRLDDARVALISANQHDPGNAELEERLQILYEALMLEPGDF
jgi:curved DNA-binding protein CbpA